MPRLTDELKPGMAVMMMMIDDETRGNRRGTITEMGLRENNVGC